MPYIQQHDRDPVDPLIEALINGLTDHVGPGLRNYVITRLMLRTTPRNYASYNEAIGVLECVKLELYRRAVASYENEKIAQNGDIRGFPPLKETTHGDEETTPGEAGEQDAPQGDTSPAEDPTD